MNNVKGVIQAIRIAFSETQNQLRIGVQFFGPALFWVVLGAVVAISGCSKSQHGHGVGRLWKQAGRTSDAEHRMVWIGQATRPASALPIPGSLKLETVVPSGARLEFAFGLENESIGDGGSVEFQLKVNGVETVVLTVESKGRQSWIEEVVDLGDYAGSNVILEFATNWAKEGSLLKPRPAMVASVLLVPEANPERPPSVILIQLDTLRADRLGCYGYEKPTSPNIDLLAAHGYRFERARSASTWTLPSTASILTGTYPSVHRTNDRDNALPDAIPYLPSSFVDAGYLTAAFTEGGFVSSKFGFARDFDVYVERRRHSGDAAQTLGMAGNWIERHTGRPYFLFLQTYEVHGPYRSTPGDFEALGEATPSDLPEEYHDFWNIGILSKRSTSDRVTQVEIDHVNALYDAGVLRVDRAVGDFFRKLEQLGELEQAIILLFSDHGEGLGDHFTFGLHGISLYEEEVRVPLILWAPGKGAGVNGNTVSTVDIVPTVLELAGLPFPAVTNGQSLVPLLTEVPGTLDRIVISQLEPNYRSPARLTCAYRDQRKIIVADVSWPDEAKRRLKWLLSRFDKNSPQRSELAARRDLASELELYDLGTDSGEQRNLAPDRKATAEQLRTELEQYATEIAKNAFEEKSARKLREDEMEQLRALGYLQ